MLSSLPVLIRNNSSMLAWTSSRKTHQTQVYAHACDCQIQVLSNLLIPTPKENSNIIVTGFVPRKENSVKQSSENSVKQSSKILGH